MIKENIHMHKHSHTPPWNMLMVLLLRKVKPRDGSVAKLCPTLCNTMDYSTPGSSVLLYSQSLLKFMSTELVMLSNHLILCWPLLLLPSIFPRIRVFSNVLALHIRWPKYWNFSISPSNEYSGLISFRIDWFDLLAVQGTFKSLLQHHTLKASILWKLSWGPGKCCLNWAVYKLSTLVS